MYFEPAAGYPFGQGVVLEINTTTYFYLSQAHISQRMHWPAYIRLQLIDLGYHTSRIQ